MDVDHVHTSVKGKTVIRAHLHNEKSSEKQKIIFSQILF